MHREELKNSDFKQTQLASLQVELGKANSNKASFRQIDLNLRATLTVTGIFRPKPLPRLNVTLASKISPAATRDGTVLPNVADMLLDFA